MAIGADIPIASLEAAAAEFGKRFVASLQTVAPHCGAASLPVGQGTASFAGLASPITCVKGIGRDTTLHQLKMAEDFLANHGAKQAVFEVAPWLPHKCDRWLTDHNYREISEEFVMLRSCSGLEPGLHKHPATHPASDRAEFTRVMLASFGLPGQPDFQRLAEAIFAMDGGSAFAFVKNGAWLGTGHLFLTGTVAILGCDGTLEAFRGTGVQSALIESRLLSAAEAGAQWAAAEVLPGSGSMRNYLRRGFSVAYSRRHFAKDLGQSGKITRNVRT